MVSNELPPECEAFAAVVNAVLDGDAPAAELASAHAQTCRDCRELAAAARLLAAAGPALRSQPAMPADLRPRLVAAMARTRRRRRWGPALAACVAVLGGVWLTWPSRPDGVAVGPAVPDSSGLPESGTAGPTNPARVADQWAAVASVARNASEKAIAPARQLATPNIRLATPDTLRPTADALATLEQASKATAEPVAGTARRAVGLFMRDFGLSAKPAG